MSFDLAIVGLGVIGGNLALNMLEHGIRPLCHDRDPDKQRRGEREGLAVAGSLEEAVGRLSRPRIVLLCLPAGPPVDHVILRLRPLLEAGDVIVDAGNSHFEHTMRRAGELEAVGIGFVGLGLSGGASGARHGACFMAGGSSAAWRTVRPYFLAVAARAEGRPCAAWLGPDGAGHFAKMVHNGIEYALMELIAEIHAFLERLLDFDPERAAALFGRWNEGELGSYLLEISGNILRRDDPITGRPVLEVVEDVVHHKGTGKWASIAALELGVATPTLIEAFTARLVSGEVRGRRARAAAWPEAKVEKPDPETAQAVLEQALLAAFVAAFAQGFELMAAGSRRYGWKTDLARLARAWRGGCIIRARLLDRFVAALAHRPKEGGILAAPWFAERLRETVGGLRRTVGFAARAGLPVPCLASALSWLEMMHAPRLHTALAQAQRDYFGGHGVRRTDRPGCYHIDGTRV
ncbi:MAG TPA: NADP-dependent phosphogluconate dehydrogenase [Rhodospirillales bacterium]|nr:NADP-dependent phosphogluconate dehydrogenase [Rhodospirillales bacterium]